MTASRRVRLSRYVNEQVGRIPQPQRIALIEYPRISSTCEGRPPIWEWRLDRAFIMNRNLFQETLDTAR